MSSSPAVRALNVAASSLPSPSASAPASASASSSPRPAPPSKKTKTDNGSAKAVDSDEASPSQSAAAAASSGDKRKAPDVASAASSSNSSISSDATKLVGGVVIERTGWKTLPVGFHWKGLAPFTVLVGINGCGKTAILELIMHAWQNHYNNTVDPRVPGARFTDGSPDASGLLLNLAAMDGRGAWPNSDAAELNSSGLSDNLFQAIGLQLWKAWCNGQVTPRAELNELDQDTWAQFRLSDFAPKSERSNEDMVRAELLNHVYRFKPFAQVHTEALSTLEGALAAVIHRLSTRVPSFAMPRPVTRLTLEEFTESFHLNSFGVKDPSGEQKRVAIGQLNVYLGECDFPHCLDESSYDDDPSVVRMRCRQSQSVFLLAGLSGGERIQLLCALWRHSLMQATPGLLLLDEPDAHLHPSLCQEFIQSVQQLIQPRPGNVQIQVIMTTHNATTVRFLDDDDCKSGRLKIFKMERGATTPVEITKRRAMQFLSQSLVSVCEPLRIVFCEAPNDVAFYDALFRRFLTIAGCLRETDAILMFKSGFGKKDPRDAASVGNSNSDCAQVERMLLQFSGGDIPVSEFVRGIVDHDNRRDEDWSVNPLRAVGQRHSIENYIYDPLIVARTLWKSVTASKICEPAWHRCVAGLSPSDVASLIALLNLGVGVKPAADAASVLQKLIDNMSEWFLDALDDMTAQLKLKAAAKPNNEAVASGAGASDVAASSVEPAAPTIQPKKATQSARAHQAKTEASRQEDDADIQRRLADPKRKLLLRTRAERKECHKECHVVKITAWNAAAAPAPPLSASSSSSSAAFTLRYPAIFLAMKGHHLAIVWQKALIFAIGHPVKGPLGRDSMQQLAQDHLPPFDDLVKMFTELQKRIDVN